MSHKKRESEIVTVELDTSRDKNWDVVDEVKPEPVKVVTKHTEVVRKTPKASDPKSPSNTSVIKNEADDELMNILFTMEESDPVLPNQNFHFSDDFINQFTKKQEIKPADVSDISESPVVEECHKPPLLPLKHKEEDVWLEYSQTEIKLTSRNGSKESSRENSHWSFDKKHDMFAGSWQTFDLSEDEGSYIKEMACSKVSDTKSPSVLSMVKSLKKPTDSESTVSWRS